MQEIVERTLPVPFGCVSMTCHIYNEVIKKNKNIDNLHIEILEALKKINCQRECFTCVYHDIDEGYAIDILLKKLKEQKILGRITSRDYCDGETFHLGFNGMVYHMTLRKITFDLYDEIERGLG